MLNIFPYNNGHLMVAPLRHTRHLKRLSETEILDVFRGLIRAQKILSRVLKPDGFNIGINIGRASGAGITGHVHIHIVPRWIGDTNFMPSIHGTKVISQSLKELHRRLAHVDAETDT
jgi:ATP adenylyltransferase